VTRSTYLVAQPPAKPTLVFDGDCEFCVLWVTRWTEQTHDAVAFQPLQIAADRFPEIPRSDFEGAVHFIEPNGRVSSGAAAVFRSLGIAGPKLNRWGYDHVPGFAGVSEAAYRLIARNRSFSHFITRLIWGKEVLRPTYARARGWFLRALGVIYLIAFLSFWVQADGLIGIHGISPLPQLLKAASAELGTYAWLTLPTLCWLNWSNGFIHFLCGAGALLSVLLVIGIMPVFCLILLFASYLSLTIAGQSFFSFQWDILLLETGFLAIFLAPGGWWLRREPPPSRTAVFLIQFLLFKLMLMSGIVKLTSGDSSWWNLTALDYHYWTQPLPTVLGWWADKSPEWVKHVSTAGTIAIELLVPFLIWLPRRPRLLACGLFLFLQIVIGLTGNYAFFNLLTIALCLFLIDDRAWPRGPRLANTNLQVTKRAWSTWPAAVVLFVTMPLNGFLFFNAVLPEAAWPPAITLYYSFLEPFRIVNGYGLFRVMTKDRPEIIIEGSDDGVDWRPYVFKWKPGPLQRMPAFVEPHQPRLDWQMWFAALSDVQQNQWFYGLMQRLLENSPEVTRLLGENPFPEKPPRYLRAELYRYRFSSRAEHRTTGAWWSRQDLREYLPMVSLRRE
jgi:predicted DCC family thiol-disulfide oxidoreductase YuxK